MTKIKQRVNRLRPGSTIGIISPSWSGPNGFPTAYAKGIENLERYFGFTIKEFKATKTPYDNTIEHVHRRVADIHEAFTDDQVDAIFISIGGDDCIRLLPFLNKELITNNPKVVLGFSDATNLLIYLAKCGIPAFHGPSVLAGFSEPEGLRSDFLNHLQSFFFDKWSIYEYPNYELWTEDPYSWGNTNFLESEKKYKPNTGIKVINKGEKNSGHIIGGCFEIIEMLKGTDFGLQKEDWQDGVFFLEASDEKPTLDSLVCALRSYGVAGAWDAVNALVICKFKNYTDEEYLKFEEKAKEIITIEFGKNITIISNVDSGHTQPMLVLPLLCNLEIDLENKKLILKETPFN